MNDKHCIVKAAITAIQLLHVSYNKIICSKLIKIAACCNVCRSFPKN